MASTGQTCHQGSIDMQPYQYETLTHPTNIRVLELFGHGGELECSLRQINVKDGGYQALSYVWGSNKSPFKITIRDASGDALGYISLTPNLHNALHDIWAAEDIERKVFWIDQICINQGGKEKNNQVALMQQIYSSADGVITYLGPAEDETDHKACCALLLEIYHSFARNYDQYFEMAALEKILQYRHILSAMELSPDIGRKLTEQNWDWLGRVATAEWHTRLWIVQEQLLNKNTVMLYGNQTLIWDAVVMLPIHAHIGVLSSERFGDLGRSHEKYFHSPHMLDMWLRRQRLFFRHDSASTNSSKVPTLLYNVKAHGDLRCTDPRDHVYALLAVSSDTAELGIVPDYSPANSIGVLSADITVRILQKDQHLIALQYVDSKHGSDDLTNPSWAVDITPDKTARHSLRWDNSAAHPRRTFSSIPKFDSEKQTLTLKGQILDTIDRPVVTFSKYETYHHGREYLTTAIDHICKVARLLLVFGSDQANAALLCRVLVGEARALSSHIEDGGDITENQALHIWSWLHCQIESIGDDTSGDIKAILDERRDSWVLASFEKELLNSAPHYAHGYSPGHKQESFGRFARAVNLDGRAVCRTSKGRMGNVPDRAEKNDVVAAFEGGNLLYVLRPAEGETYRFVGTAYIEGLMNGEAYKDRDIDKVDHDIVLV